MASNFLARFLPGGTISHKMDSSPKKLEQPPNTTQKSPPPSQTPPSQTPIVIHDTPLDDQVPFISPNHQDDEDDDSITFSTPAQRKKSLRAPRKNMSLKAQENMNATLDRKSSPSTALFFSTIVTLLSVDVDFLGLFGITSHFCSL